MPYIKKTHPALLMLQARFPVAFDKPRRPLAVGIREEVRALVPVEELNEQKLQQALASHTGRITYLQACLVDGARRVHLDGSDAGEVTEDGKRIAREKLGAIEAQMQARQQKEAERKANPPAPPVKKEKKPQPAKPASPVKPLPPVEEVKPRKEKTVPVVQVKKRRVLVKDA
jgi:ProP effector